MNKLNGLILNEEGKAFLEKSLGTVNSEFIEAIETLCDQMNLTKGTISEEGQMTTCPVHYSLSSPNGFYAIQVVGTVIGTTDEILCYLMIVNTTPLLKTHTGAYTGRWCSKTLIWEFSEG